MRRKEKRIIVNEPDEGQDPEKCSTGIDLTFTRKGLEVSGWFDNCVGMPRGFLSWKEMDKIREELSQKGIKEIRNDEKTG